MIQEIIYLNDSTFLYNKKVESKISLEKRVKNKKYFVDIYSLNRLKEEIYLDDFKFTEKILLTKKILTDDILLDIVRNKKKEFKENELDKVYTEVVKELFFVLRNNTFFYNYLTDIICRSLYNRIKKDGYYLNFNILQYIFKNCLFYRVEKEEVGILYNTLLFIKERTKLNLCTVRSNIRKLESYGILKQVVGNKKNVIVRLKEYLKRIGKMESFEFYVNNLQFCNFLVNNSFLYYFIDFNKVIELIEEEDFSSYYEDIKEYVIKNVFNNLSVRNNCYKALEKDVEIDLYKNLEKKFLDKNYFENLKNLNLDYNKIVDEYFVFSEYIKGLYLNTAKEVLKKDLKFLRISLLNIDYKFVNCFDKNLKSGIKINKDEILKKMIRFNKKVVNDFMKFKKDGIMNNYLLNRVRNKIYYNLEKRYNEYRGKHLFIEMFKEMYENVYLKNKFLYLAYKTFVGGRNKSPIFILKKIENFLEEYKNMRGYG